MKISELTTKGFLGKNGAAENSYVLVNYADPSSNTPVTYKATIKELGKAIVKELDLMTVETSGGAVELRTYGTNNTGTDYTAYDAEIPITNVNKTDTTKRPVIYDTHLEGLYYAPSQGSFYTQVEVGGGNNDGGGASGTPVTADLNDEDCHYLFIDGSSRVLIGDEYGSGTPIGSLTPRNIEISQTVYSYVLVNPSGYAATAASSGDLRNYTGGRLVFYDASEKAFTDIDGSVVDMPSPVAVDVSNESYNYVAFNDSFGMIAVGPYDGYGHDFAFDFHGYPVIYNTTLNEMGYYGANATWHSLANE